MSSPVVSLYPPSIQDAPPDLTTPSADYRMRVVTVLVCIVSFVLLYISLLFGSAWLIYSGIEQALDSPAPQHTGEPNAAGWCIAYAVMAAIVFLFLVKSLFKFQKSATNTLMEVTEEEYPVLFYFVNRICEDTKAPVPAKIFVTHDVNAAVFYSNSVLSLFMPVEKNLLIGLGLVNSLNMSEFKAVLAHEFGHFSQSSMRLGSYVYVANHVITDLVYRRDYLDTLLDDFKRLNLRIAIFAWAIYGVLRVLRGILGVAFRLINFQDRALSRQMEFHADLVAVSITGSDSLVHVLKKLDFANLCMQHAATDLESAALHNRFSADFYYHQTRAADYLRRKDQGAGQVPEIPADGGVTTQVFTDETAPAMARMWATHPTNHDREQNAKRTYLRGPNDERTPWLLFSNSAGLRRRMTQIVYRELLKRSAKDLMPPEEVQLFIDAEHQEMEHCQRYNGFYDGRWLQLQPAELPRLLEHSRSIENSISHIEASAKRIYEAEYVRWMAAHKVRRNEMGLLVRLQSTDRKKEAVTTFDFRGVKHSKAEIESLAAMVDKELDADTEWLTAFDTEVMLSHLCMARFTRSSNDTVDREQDLYGRYLFQLNLQALLRGAIAVEGKLSAIYQYVAARKGNLSKHEHVAASQALREAYSTMSFAVRGADGVAMPALTNVEKGVKLSSYIVSEEFAEPIFNEAHFDMDLLRTIGGQNRQIQNRGHRLYYKSMGALLSCQESIWEQYMHFTVGQAQDQSTAEAPYTIT